MTVKLHTVLYLGLNPPEHSPGVNLIHFPVIQIIPRTASNPEIQRAFEVLPRYSHLIFTSRNAVDIFSNFLTHFPILLESLNGKIKIAVGKATATQMTLKGFPANIVANEETADGVVNELKNLNLKDAFVFWPHAAGARTIITDYLKTQSIKFNECILYDTATAVKESLPNLDQIDEIIFTSPSTVKAFLQLFGKFPKNKKLTSIGPITRAFLEPLVKVN
jgi:uroporphyrinogen-III synthase